MVFISLLRITYVTFLDFSSESLMVEFLRYILLILNYIFILDE